jgi:hypothetical protein
MNFSAWRQHEYHDYDKFTFNIEKLITINQESQKAKKENNII